MCITLSSSRSHSGRKSATLCIKSCVLAAWPSFSLNERETTCNKSEWGRRRNDDNDFECQQQYDASRRVGRRRIQNTFSAKGRKRTSFVNIILPAFYVKKDLNGERQRRFSKENFCPNYSCCRFAFALFKKKFLYFPHCGPHVLMAKYQTISARCRRDKQINSAQFLIMSYTKMRPDSR